MTTTPPTNEPNFDDFPRQVLNEIREMRSELQRLSSDLEKTNEQVKQASIDLATESKRWDERFFQLSRDTLNFSRNVIVTAAIVAVLVPILRDTLPALFEFLKSR